MSEASIYRRLADSLLEAAAASDDPEERARLSYEALALQVKATDAESGSDGGGD